MTGAQPGALLGVQETRELFRKVFADGRRKKGRLNHWPLFLDVLEGKVDFQCEPWGIPSYSLFGGSGPCYLMSGEYAITARPPRHAQEVARTPQREVPAC
jgi:hypothetical protein